MREINRTVISVVVVALPLTVISLLTVWPRGLSLAFGVSLLFIAACRLLEKEHRLADVKRWRRVAQDLKIAGHPC